jgi:hypothetical protein
MTAARDHSWIEELLSVDALGGLDAEDRETLFRELSSHGPDCAECAGLQRESREVAGRLAFALRPVSVRAGLEEETVQLARDRGESVALYRKARGGRLRARLARPHRRPRFLLRPAIAVGLAIVMFVAGWAIRSLTEPALDIGNATVVSFQTRPVQPEALAVAYEKGTTGGILFGSRLAEPPSDRTYELWMFQNGTPVRATCFTPQARGEVLESFHADFAASQQMAVTVESTSCPLAPTTKPILTADLTGAA